VGGFTAASASSGKQAIKLPRSHLTSKALIRAVVDVKLPPARGLPGHARPGITMSVHRQLVQDDFSHTAVTSTIV